MQASRRILAGRAHADGLRSYFEQLARTYRSYLPRAWHTDPPTLEGWRVSRLGFGTYRVARGVDHRAHSDALREALLSGTNVIDTAANYGDGEAEALIGATLEEVVRARRLRRDQIVIIGKAGYIQGENLQRYRRHRDRYAETVDFDRRLKHSIEPAFLDDQLSLSLRRMRLDCIDVFLLHNPEYFLIDAERRGVPAGEAREIYAGRLQRAFAYLEEQVAAGRISCYGVSSNTLAGPGDAATTTRLDEAFALAGPGFRVVQFSANLLESDFRFSRRSLDGQPISDWIAERGLWALSNRPLNAAHPQAGLVRLARLPNPPPDDGLSALAEFDRMQGRLKEMEADTLRIFAEYRFRFDDERSPAPSSFLERYRDAYLHREQFRRALPAISEAVRACIHDLKQLERNDEQRFAIEGLMRLTNASFALWEKRIDAANHQRLQGLEEALGQAAPALRGKPLAVQALQFLLAREVPRTVLVGMRRTAYVRQLMDLYQSALPAEAQSMKIAAAAEDGVEEMLRAFAAAQNQSADALPADTSASPDPPPGPDPIDAAGA